MTGPVELVSEVRETHCADVLLLGDRAYKIKKPVDLGFLDFRTVEARAAACEREVELNRRLAPDVYLDLATVTGSDGAVCDHVVVMRRMPSRLRLSGMAERGAECHDHLRALARLMAGFHAAAERGPQIDAEAGAVGLARRWEDNLRETEPYSGTAILPRMHRRIAHLAREYVAGRQPLFEERRAQGAYVDGHGDLTADDVFCLPDHPRVLDCIEFDDRLRWVDVLDDVAFLAMDLERLGRADLAEHFLAQYTQFSGTPAVPSLQHHYVAYRAYVRAKVTCIRSEQIGIPAQELIDRCTELALHHLEAGEITLTLVGGAPGTGKTTVAGCLADDHGAVLLSSDAVRAELPAELAGDFGPAGTAAVYRALLERAGRALERGESVIADATWGDPALRTAAEDLAAATHSRFVAIECHAPVELAVARVGRRARGGSTGGSGASQADEQVARELAARRVAWPTAIAVDTSGTLAAALQQLGSLLAAAPPSASFR